MTQSDRSGAIGIVGGTGPQGRGLAARWGRAGYDVWIGSRTEDKANDIAQRVRERVGSDVAVHGAENLRAVRETGIVVVTVPYEAQASTLPDLRDAIGDKAVVSVVVPVEFDEVGPRAVPVGEGSAAEQCQALLPDARVVGAFHDVPAGRLWAVDEPVDCDALICGDDPDAIQEVVALAGDIPGMRAVECGPLRNSSHLENVTPVLLWVNRRYGVKAGLRVTGLEEPAARP